MAPRKPATLSKDDSTFAIYKPPWNLATLKKITLTRPRPWEPDLGEVKTYVGLRAWYGYWPCNFLWLIGQDIPPKWYEDAASHERERRWNEWVAEGLIPKTEPYTPKAKPFFEPTEFADADGEGRHYHRDGVRYIKAVAEKFDLTPPFVGLSLGLTKSVLEGILGCRMLLSKKDWEIVVTMLPDINMSYGGRVGAVSVGGKRRG